MSPAYGPCTASTAGRRRRPAPRENTRWRGSADRARSRRSRSRPPAEIEPDKGSGGTEFFSQQRCLNRERTQKHENNPMQSSIGDSVNALNRHEESYVRLCNKITIAP